jgi:GntR family transcriptional regulator / MocR family aminotransferase
VRPVAELDLPLHLDRGGRSPLHAQVAAALRQAVLDGRLPAAARLPATRTLAAQLGVARATVITAYEQLSGEGYLEAGHGSGTYVNRQLPAVPGHDTGSSPVERPRDPAQPVLDLRPGRPDTGRLVDPAWRRAWRAAAEAVPSTDPPFDGVPELRSEIAAHLRSARGVPAEPDGVLVTAGTNEGLALAAHALGLAGRPVVVEDPGYPAARRVLTRLGVVLAPVAVDERGLRADELRQHPDVAAVLVTPSHQYPLGGIMPVDRRLTLLAAARAAGATVLEDDYDSEFRYGIAPLPALAALDPATVVHIGTFSKVLSPWLRAGFLLVPPALRETFRAVRMDLGPVVSGVQQHALAGYLASGALRRHIARSRRDYAHRRAHLGRLLEAHPMLRSRDSHAGLHAVIALPQGTDVPRLLCDLAADGILLADLADYAVSGTWAEPAVVLGYGAATTVELDRVIGALAARCRSR